VNFVGSGPRNRIWDELRDGKSSASARPRITAIVVFQTRWSEFMLHLGGMDWGVARTANRTRLVGAISGRLALDQRGFSGTILALGGRWHAAVRRGWALRTLHRCQKRVSRKSRIEEQNVLGHGAVPASNTMEGNKKYRFETCAMQYWDHYKLVRVRNDRRPSLQEHPPPRTSERTLSPYSLTVIGRSTRRRRGSPLTGRNLLSTIANI
jgi:hypothetical protein